MGKGSEVKKECCSARDILWYLTFIGFAMNYMVRVNLNMAIVSMVHIKPKSLNSTSECINQNSPSELLKALRNDTFGESPKNFENITWQQHDLEANKLNKKSRTFDWDEKQQSLVLGAFFWLHWVTQVPGGLLSAKYGSKFVFGLANFTGVLCCFFIPPAAYMGYNYLIILRVVQGVSIGFAWPAMHTMTARWIPPNERSKFVTAYLGSSVGSALTYPICGFISHRWGWELVFYTCGVIGTLWFIGWYFLVYDSPSQHPRISPEEKAYILESIGQTYSKEKAPVPWKDIFTSLPVWMNLLAQVGGMWGFFTLMTQAPTYFKVIHGSSTQVTGLLAGLGHILRVVWSYISGQLGDYLLRTNKMSRTNVRKMATACCTIGTGVFMLALAFSGCNYVLAVIFLSAAVAMNGSVSTGILASMVDISPNYASVILGLVNSCVACIGFITPAVVGYLTYQNQTIHQWAKVFWIATFMVTFNGILYLLFSKSELQPWNSPKQGKEGESELITIKSNQEKVDNKDGYKSIPVIADT